jgi:thioredoxin
MVELNEGNFAAHVAGGVTVIDFWAAWCGPCKQLAPAFAEAAGALEQRAAFAKLDVDAAPTIAREHQVMSIPTILVLRDGVEVGRLVGGRSAHQLRSELEQILN